MVKTLILKLTFYDLSMEDSAPHYGFTTPAKLLLLGFNDSHHPPGNSLPLTGKPFGTQGLRTQRLDLVAQVICSTLAHTTVHDHIECMCMQECTCLTYEADASMRPLSSACATGPIFSNAWS